MHLNERLAEYVYEELNVTEMAEAREHVAACPDCRLRAEEFERIHHALRALPDEDLPRRIVFAPADHVKQRFAAPLRWLAPAGVAAAAVLAVVLAGPIRMDWHDSQLTIAFGAASPAPSPAQPPDYLRLTGEIQQVRTELAYLENLQRTLWKETLQNASSIQLLAQRGN